MLSLICNTDGGGSELMLLNPVQIVHRYIEVEKQSAD